MSTAGNAFEGTAVMPTYARYPVTFVRGEGMHLFDDRGRDYLDFAGALGAMPLGHSHPRWREAVHRQVDELALVTNLYNTLPQAALAARLVGLLEMGPSQVFLSNSGAEANEAALKLVRKWGLPNGRAKIVALDGSFHGRSVATLAATGQPAKRAAFEPLVDWFEHVPPEDVRALDAAVDDRTAAVMVEPVLGEGGVRPLSAGYLQHVRATATDRGALLIADEVQAGMGRCGAWRSSSLSGVVPDLVTLAKGLGGGLPIGATISRTDIAFGPGDHASTFGGGPIPCAAALAVLDVIEDGELLDNAATRGAAIMDGLKAAVGGHASVREIRGLGLLVGVELVDPRAKQVVLALLEDGVLATEASPAVVRLSPPLIVGDGDVETVVTSLAAAVDRVARAGDDA